MEISFSSKTKHDFAFVDITIFEDKGEDQPWNKAEIILQVPYDDSNAVIHERATAELTTFLRNAINHLENSNSQ